MVVLISWNPIDCCPPFGCSELLCAILCDDSSIDNNWFAFIPFSSDSLLPVVDSVTFSRVAASCSCLSSSEITFNPRKDVSVWD